MAIKNYGEIQASSVIGMSTTRSELPPRDIINGDGMERFNLGPLLPYMEKRHWIFVDSATIERAKSGGQVFAVIYFLYDFAAGGRSGYGMISEYDSKANSFVHRDIWVDQESMLKNSTS